MLSFIRRQLSVTNLMVVAALIFAMAGGAFAASSGGNNHAHQAGQTPKGRHNQGTVAKRGPRGLRGATGPEGKQGPEGQPGPHGERGPIGETGATGAKGAPGKNGTNGKSVAAAEELPGGNCAEGGTNFEVEGTLIKHYVCNGVKGANGANGESVKMTPLPKGNAICKEGGEELTVGQAKGYACNGEAGAGAGGSGVLEKGETERGTWDANAPVEATSTIHLGFTHVTYPRPTRVVPKVVVVKQSETAHETECPGTAKAPRAAEGYLCLYALGELNITVSAIAYEWGAILSGKATSAKAAAYGSWAMTAE